MNQYADNLKVKDALQIYFSQYHFKDGGYNDWFFKIKVGSFYVPFPNIKPRVDAVKLHDLHHLLTEYNANYKGEAEIGGWEIGSGCGRYWMAWILNMGSFIIGMLFYQQPLLKAFLDGRLVKTNLYQGTIYNDDLLNKSVGELRKGILPQSTTKNSAKDYWLFACWCLISLIYHLAVVSIFIYCVIKLISFFV
ncbi:MAG: hypothetical protein ABI855_03870 [Bacteroidota bacterium]